MSFELDVKADISRTRAMLGASQKAVQLATVTALNKTVTNVRSETVKVLKKDIGDAVGVTSGGFRKSIALAKANRNRLLASLTPSGRPLPLMAFGARQVATGVTSKAWGKRKTYKHAFIAKMPGGHKGVFVRTSKKRLPIRELYGPSLPREFTKEKIAGTMKRLAGKAWAKNWAREFNYYQRKYGA